MSARRTAPAAPPAAPVGGLQRWFQGEVMQRDGGPGAASRRRVARELLPSAALTAEARLDIYRSAYFLRLRDVLRNDFTGLLHALGEPGFDRLARGYVDACPSRSFTLNDLAARLPRHLERAPLPARLRSRRPFLVEIATLERTVDELFHAPHAPPADVETLRALPPERWAATRFRPIPAARLFAFRHPVGRWLQAVYDGKSPPLPAPAPSWLLVHRRDFRVWRSPLSATQHALLTSLFRGATLRTAVQHAARTGGKEELAAVGSWFTEWTREGLFAAITPARR